jgi:hypothetical protein
MPPCIVLDYDFPDDLIPIGVRAFHRVIRDLLG